MSHIARRRTLGTAESLLRDIKANLNHPRDYVDSVQLERDSNLFDALYKWVFWERKDETDLVNKESKRENKE